MSSGIISQGTGTFTFNHNLGAANHVVQCFDNTTNTELGGIKVVFGANTDTLTFGSGGLADPSSCVASSGGAVTGPVGGDLTNSLPSPSVAKFASDINVTANGIANMACNGATDDTAALTTLSAQAVNLRIPAGVTCIINNPTITSHTHIYLAPGARLLKCPVSTCSTSAANYFITASSKSDFLIEGGTLDFNSITQTTSNLYPIYISGGSFSLNRVTLQNTGTPSTSMGGVDCYAASCVITNNTVASSIYGNPIKITPNAVATNVSKVLDNTISSPQADAIYVNNFSEGVCNVEVAGNVISNVTDSAADAGQTGNAIHAYYCDGVIIHANTTTNTRYAGVRLTTSSNGKVYDNIIGGALETAMYCAELGGSHNDCHDNHIYNSMSGIDATNVSNRSPDAPNFVHHNWIVNSSYYGVYGEHDAVYDNQVDGAPICFAFGHGSTSHDNTTVNNTCYNSSTTYTPVAVAFAVDIGMVGTTTFTNNVFSGANSPTVAPIMATNLPSALTITGITQANPAVLTYTGTQPNNGNVFVIAQVTGMPQINGLTCTVANSTSTTFQCSNINSSSFSAFTGPIGGTSPRGQAVEVFSSGTTPAYNFANNVLMRDVTLPFGYLSRMSNGSQIFVSDGTAGATCTGGGTGALGVLKNGTWSCF